MKEASVKYNLNKLRLLESQKTITLDNNVNLITSFNISDNNREEFFQHINELSSTVKSFTDNIFFNVNSGNFVITIKVNLGNTDVEIIMNSNRERVLLAVDKSELIEINSSLVTLLSNLTLFFNEKRISAIKNIINNGVD